MNNITILPPVESSNDPVVRKLILDWWMSRKPCDWTVAEFAENPTCNRVADSADGRLAVYAASLVANQPADGGRKDGRS